LDEAIVHDLANRLSQSVDQDSQGRPQLTITLPDQSALRGLATTLANTQSRLRAQDLPEADLYVTHDLKSIKIAGLARDHGDKKSQAIAGLA
jgi:hypothetical protein